jgi:anthranilate synthase component 1
VLPWLFYFPQMSMYFPEQKAFSEMMEQAGLVPLHRTVIADLETPLTIFAKIAGDERHAFLFESMEGGEKWGRYSFIGLAPLLTFTSKGGQVTLSRCGRVAEVREGVNPLTELRELLASFKASTAPGLPRFYGGLVGFLGYDMIRFIEEIPDRHAPLDNIPDSSFIVPRLVLIHDAISQKLTVVCNVVREEKGKDTAELYQDGCQRIEAVLAQLRQPLPEAFRTTAASYEPHQFRANMDEQRFCQMVRKILLPETSFKWCCRSGFRPKPSLTPSCFTGPCGMSIPALISSISAWTSFV